MGKRFWVILGFVLFMTGFPVSAEARELLRESTEIEVDYGDADNLQYIPAEGTVNGCAYKRNPDDGYWVGNWYNALSVTKVITRVYDEDGEEVTETERVKVSCFDESEFDRTTFSSVFPEDYYILKGATAGDYGSYRIMQFNPDPEELTELTVVYDGEEYTVPYEPVEATLTGYKPFSYSVMLRDISDAEFNVYVSNGNYTPVTREAFESVHLNFREDFLFNYFEIAGYGFDENFNLVVTDLNLKRFYGMKAGDRFDSSTLKPAMQAKIVLSTRNEPGTGTYELEAAMYPEWELSFDEIEEGYTLTAADNYRTFSGKLTEENGTEHAISVIVGVQAPELYASYVVSVPAAIELTEGEEGFTGEMSLSVDITSNNEDFYVSVVPQDLVVTGALTGDVFPVEAFAERTRFQISDETMEQEEDTFRDSGVIELSTNGFPERADTYIGVFTVLISSGTE